MKLKLNTSSAAASSASTPAATPTPSTAGGGGGFKLKIKASAPPTPATEFPPPVTASPLGPPLAKPKRKYTKKADKLSSDSSSSKRAAETDISPAAKRRISFKLGGGSHADEDDIVLATPTSASAKGPKLKIMSRKHSIGPKQITLTAKKRPPQRPVGVGYDSEASDAEADPAIETQFVLRMAEGEDSEYLRGAIENRLVGVPVVEGGADVSFRFVDRDLRRAMVTVRGRRYAAVMVDLPCIVETMKSWDKRGWWKVADICQMLLVLGRCRDEEEAKGFALPREVDRNSLAYAHGLTPPMHWVRKRRFKKRVSYREIENVEDEVEKLLKDDAAAIRSGGDVDWKILDTSAIHNAEMMQHDEYNDEDGYMESTEDQYGQAQNEDYEDEDAEGEDAEMDDVDLEAQLMAELDDNDVDQAEPVTADAAASLGDVLSAQPLPSSVIQSSNPLPGAAIAAATAHEASSDEDEDDEDDEDDADSIDAIDEDAVALENEEAQKREEIEDLEREVRNKRLELERTTNQLLKSRTRQNLSALEDELAMKRKAFDMEVDE